jgi:hypothetical protein
VDKFKLFVPASNAVRLPPWQFHWMVLLTPVLKASVVVKPVSLAAVTERG